MKRSTTTRRTRHRRVADRDRKRAPRACDRCKSRKQSCVETASGICQRCLRGFFTCRFDKKQASPVPTEDTQPIHQVDHLVNGNETHANVPETDTELPIEAHPRPQTDAGGYDLLVANPAASQESESEPVRRPSLQHQRCQHQDQHDLHIATVSPEGATSEMFMWPRFLSKLRGAFGLEPQPATATQEPYITQLHERMSQPASTSPAHLHRLQGVIDRFPPRGVANFLLSVCIRYGTDSFYYFNQATFSAELDNFYTDQGSALRRDAAFISLALATFALGSQWTRLAKPDDLNESLSPSQGSDPGRLFYELARTLMGDIIDRACVRSVQAAYVLGVYLMPASAIGASYVYMGLALRKALAIALHQESDDHSLGQDEREARRRLFWAVWSLERMITIKLNRPRSVSQDIITVGLPQPLPGDVDQKFNNVQHQIANAKLTKIMDTLAQPATWSDHTELPPEDYAVTLKSWKRSLPAELKLETTDPRSSSYRAVFHLYLNYYFAWIALGKVSVVTIVRSRLRGAHSPSSEQTVIDDRVESLALSCTKAARKMLSLFEHLVRTGNLTRFSFTDFQGCSIATIIMLLAGILDRGSEYRKTVNFGIECLRKMAGDNLTARTGVKFVEALQSIADEAWAKLAASQPPETECPPESSTDLQSSDYAQWVRWLARAEQQGTSYQHDGTPQQTQNQEPTAYHFDYTGSPNLDPVIASTLQLQGLSASTFGMSLDSNGLAESSTSSALDLYLPSSVLSDDQLYLMGLTGMDVLDFTTGSG
ncbi:thiamine repressible genes regulatory protein thi1 [Fusarium avenaceum]|nr:thiamine repressible genes regulatory protein thi1 [Fusarium avenaceum]